MILPWAFSLSTSLDLDPARSALNLVAQENDKTGPKGGSIKLSIFYFALLNCKNIDIFHRTPAMKVRRPSDMS